MEKAADIRRRLKKEKELAIAKHEWQEYKYGKYDYVPIPDWLIPYFNKFWDAEDLERSQIDTESPRYEDYNPVFDGDW